MICTCDRCKINFFPGEPPILCPECGGEVVVRQGWPELHYLVTLLAKGEIREALASYIDTQPEKAPELMEVVDHINTLLDSIPRETSDRYFMEINYLKGFLIDYCNEQYYEVLHRRGIPKIQTMGTKMLMGLMSLEQKLAQDIPGAGEKLMPWAYPESKMQKQIKVWRVGAEGAFRHFMPPISAPYPNIYFSEAYNYRKVREKLLEETGCPLQGWPDDISLEYIHGDKGGAILFRLDQLPDKIPFSNFLHLSKVVR